MSDSSKAEKIAAARKKVQILDMFLIYDMIRRYDESRNICCVPYIMQTSFAKTMF